MCTHHCLLPWAFQLKVSHQGKLTHAQFCLTWFGLYTTWPQEQGNLELGIEGWDWNQTSALLHFSECLFLVCSLKRRKKKLKLLLFFSFLQQGLFTWLLVGMIALPPRTKSKQQKQQKKGFYSDSVLILLGKRYTGFTFHLLKTYHFNDCCRQWRYSLTRLKHSHGSLGP